MARLQARRYRLGPDGSRVPVADAGPDRPADPARPDKPDEKPIVPATTVSED